MSYSHTSTFVIHTLVITLDKQNVFRFQIGVRVFHSCGESRALLSPNMVIGDKALQVHEHKWTFLNRGLTHYRQ